MEPIIPKSRKHKRILNHATELLSACHEVKILLEMENRKPGKAMDNAYWVVVKAILKAEGKEGLNDN